MKKRRFFTSHSKSSALVVSLAIHAVLIVVALSFVAVKVIVKEDQPFEAKRVKRPKMPPKKIQVPMEVKKRKPKPRLRKRIVVNTKTLADIKMPEISGIKGGLGNMGGDGLGSLGFDLNLGLFGGDRSTGNELSGTFYDLRKTDKGAATNMAQQDYDTLIKKFVSSWQPWVLKRFFKAPKTKYATAFCMPVASASAAPEAFGVSGSKNPMWLIHYTGSFAAPESGHYRFCGQADDILYIRLKRRLVLDASWPTIYGRFSGWDSNDDNNKAFPLANNQMVIGDWFKMEKGVPMEIDLLLGEGHGGLFNCRLLIEKKGSEYRQAPYTYGERSGMRPVLPIFKTKEIPEELVGKMKLNSNQETLEGPSFGAVSNLKPRMDAP